MRGRNHRSVEKQSHRREHRTSRQTPARRTATNLRIFHAGSRPRHERKSTQQICRVANILLPTTSMASKCRNWRAHYSYADLTDVPLCRQRLTALPVSDNALQARHNGLECGRLRMNHSRLMAGDNYVTNATDRTRQFSRHFLAGYHRLPSQEQQAHLLRDQILTQYRQDTCRRVLRP